MKDVKKKKKKKETLLIDLPSFFSYETSLPAFYHVCWSVPIVGLKKIKNVRFLLKSSPRTWKSSTGRRATSWAIECVKAGLYLYLPVSVALSPLRTAEPHETVWPFETECGCTCVIKD